MYFSIFLFTSFLIFSYVLPAILDIEFAIDKNLLSKDVSWCLGKDDVKPIDIFNAFREKGTEKEKELIAKAHTTEGLDLHVKLL